MRTIGYVLLGCTLLSGVGRLASADIFKCHLKGKVVFQNHPCGSEEGTQPYIEHREAPTSPPTLVPLTAPVVVPPAQTLSPPPAATPPPAPLPGSVPPRQTVPEAKSVDTTQLALLEIGSGMGEVRRRLGPPAAEFRLPSKIVMSRGVGHVVERMMWRYPSTYGIPATRIYFENGWVVSKWRED